MFKLIVEALDGLGSGSALEPEVEVEDVLAALSEDTRVDTGRAGSSGKDFCRNKCILPKQKRT